MTTIMTNTGTISDIYVGTPATLSAKKSYNVHFCNFRSLESEKGIYILSPELECHGYKWRIKLYPGGSKLGSNSNSKEGWVALYLSSANDKAVKAKFSYFTPKASYDFASAVRVFGPLGGKNAEWGYPNYHEREALINSCLDGNGTLTIRLDIQVYTDKPCRWKPKKTLKSDILQMFKSGENADVSFSVEGETIKAHRLILKLRAPLLGDIVAISSQTGTNVPIPGVKADVFRSLLEFLYSDKYSENTSREVAQEVLVAANKFGCQRLKLLAEVELVEKYLNIGVAIDLLLFADSNSCAYLKETSMHLIARNTSTAKKSPDWIKLNQSSDLLRELISHLVGDNVDYNNIKDKYSKLSVREILSKLEEKDLEVDGTRNMLLKRLRDNDSDEEDGDVDSFRFVSESF